MKRFLPIIGVGLLAAVAVYAFVARARNAELARQAASAREQFEAERQQLERQLDEARKRPTVINRIEPAGTPEAVPAATLDPEQILATLKTLRASTRDPRSIRRVIFHLEQLHEIGPEAVPAIRAFLNKFEDVDYYSVRAQGDTDNEGGRQRGNDESDRGPRGGENRGDRPRFDPRDFRTNSRFDVRLSFPTPPSLRMGLVDVLQSIGGPEAEEALAEMLETTGRAVEVAYVAKILQELAPNKHAPTAVASAKDLLLNPLQAANGDRLDENAKDYLYYVLMMFNDTSFAANAQTMLVGNDGKIDRRALSYLTQTLKDQSMPAIYQAYLDQRITNQMERATLMNLALNYAGPNQQANEMLNSVITDQNIPSQMKAMALMGLTRGEPDKSTLQARLPLVEALKGSTDDQRVLRSLEITQQNLQNMIEGKPVEDRWRGFFMGADRSPEQQNDQQPRNRRGRGAGQQVPQGISPAVAERYGLPPAQ